MRASWLLVPLLTLAQRPSDTFGSVEFFGYGTLKPADLRERLPIKTGDAVPEDLTALRAKIRALTGRTPTDVAPVCCDAGGRRILYVGLGGGAPFRYLPKPKGRERLPAEAMARYEATMAAWEDAVRRGVAGEDTSQGYSLGVDPALRERQMALRAYVLDREAEIARVLRDAADDGQRAVAAQFLGYVRQSPGQIAGLLRAVRDPNEDVRNNATRALAVLAASSPEVAQRIPFDPFVAMLRSGVWTDRNKAAYVLSALTAPRDPKLLAALRRKALPELIEMARWQTGHAFMYRLILGRVEGIADDKLFPLAASGDVEEIVRAAKARA